MTELAFHFGAPDKLAYTCRLLRKAVGSGAKVLLVAEAGTARRLDADLWALSATEFVPHAVAAAEASPALQRSPLVLATDTAQVPHFADVLVNLTDTVPTGFERFARVIEVVGTDVADREHARRRWRHYTEQGYAIVRHDLALKRAD